MIRFSAFGCFGLEQRQAGGGLWPLAAPQSLTGISRSSSEVLNAGRWSSKVPVRGRFLRQGSRRCPRNVSPSGCFCLSVAERGRPLFFALHFSAESVGSFQQRLQVVLIVIPSSEM